MKHLLLLTLLLSSTLSAWSAQIDKQLTITIGGKQRTFWLYVPDSVASPTPLVLSLHGTGGHAKEHLPFVPAAADKARCAVAYPQGEELFFPVFGGKAPGWRSTGEPSEDLDFFRAIIDTVSARIAVDHERVYCCGFSNGGMMAYTMANVATDIFAAFASISGFPLNEFHLHHTGRPVPFLHIHGKQDDFVRYRFMPTIVANFTARNGAMSEPQRTQVAGRYDKSVYRATAGGFPYVYYEVDGMGHHSYTDRTDDGNSALTMWCFMSRYTLSAPRDTTLRLRLTPDTTGDFVYGGEQKTKENQNVYRSLQMENGPHTLLVTTQGSPKAKAVVRLVRLTGDHATVLDKKIALGRQVSLPLTVQGGWAEYQLTITRTNPHDAMTVSSVELHSGN